MFETILAAIRSHDRIILHRHKNPDGDALGSQIGLKHILKENFPEKEIRMVGDNAGRYGFMEDSVMDEVADEAFADALSIILDCSATHLISDDRYTLAKTGWIITCSSARSPSLKRWTPPGKAAAVSLPKWQRKMA